MTAQKSIKTKTFVLALTTLALQACGKGGAPNLDSNSSVVQMTAPVFSEIETSSIQSVSDPETIQSSVRNRFVKINMDVLKAALTGENHFLNLNFFDDQQIEVNLDQIKQLAENNFVATGRIPGDDDSAVSLVLNGDALVANVRKSTDGEAYEVRYNKDGVHTVTVPTEENGESCTAEAAPSAPGESTLSESIQAQVDQAGILATPVIDMLVAYTPLARSRQGGTPAIRALIQMGIADTNRALSDSGVNLQVRLAGMIETKQNETGSWSSDLGKLSGKTDGLWDELHAERTRVGADQVTLVGSYQTGASTAGIGYIGATKSSAFTIVKANAFGQYTFSHELGHNLGLQHSDGYVNSSGKFRTIIAYGSYPRIRRYSNPNIAYNGYKTGDSSHYESSILNSHASGLAAFVSPTGATAKIAADIQSVEAVSDAAMAADQMTPEDSSLPDAAFFTPTGE